MRPMGTAAYGGKGQGKGKGRGEGRLGQGGRGRSKGGEKPMGTTAYGGKGSKGRAANGDRPVGAASCRRDLHTTASCQNPPIQIEIHGAMSKPPWWCAKATCQAPLVVWQTAIQPGVMPKPPPPYAPHACIGMGECMRAQAGMQACCARLVKSRPHRC